MIADGLELDVVVSEMFAENAYIARRPGRDDCLIIDPGFDPDRIIEVVEDKEFAPAAILNTHGHADHIAGNAAMKKRWPDCPLVIGAGDESKLTDPMGNLSGTYGIALTSPPADQTVQEGDVVKFAGFELEIFEIPGHSVGHVVFVCKATTPWIVFGGDVLFRGSIGRTDFPDGNHEHLLDSIRKKLYTLPDDTIVLPGHGDATTVGDEKRHNPFVRG